MPFIPSRRADFGTERPPNPPCAFDLTRTLPDDVGLGWTADECLPALMHRDGARYTPDPFGPLDARRAVARFLATLDADCDPESLVLAPGTSDLFARILEALTDPGDDVLVPEPGYPLLDMIARTLGIALRPYPLSPDDPHLDAAALRARVGPRTRAVLVTSPHNPTGWRLATDDLDVLADLGLPVVADEVFRGYDNIPGPAPSALRLRGKLPVAVLGGLSKAALLPGMKVAWASIDAPDGPLFRNTVGLLSDTWLGTASPALAALPRWLEDAPKKRDALRRRVDENLTVLRTTAIACPALTAPVPASGWYATLRLPAVLDEDAWVAAFAREDVMVTPGWLFDFRGAPRVVLSLVVPTAIFADGLRRIGDVVRSIVDRR